MPDTLVILQLEHRTITRLLALLELQRNLIQSGSAPDLELLHLIFEYFRDFPDLCHHPKEDLVYRSLEKKDAAAAKTVGDLLLDHEELSRLTVVVAEAVEHAHGGGVFSPQELDEQLAAFAREYRRHLEAEEWYFFPAVSKTLDRNDWDLIDFQMFDQKDPLYDETAEGRFIALRKLIWEATDPSRGNGSA